MEAMGKAPLRKMVVGLDQPSEIRLKSETEEFRPALSYSPMPHIQVCEVEKSWVFGVEVLVLTKLWYVVIKFKSSIGSVDSSKYLKTYILTDSFHDDS